MKFYVFLAMMIGASTSHASVNEITYPERAWMLDKSGYVRVIYDIDSQGKVGNVRIVESHPKFLFDDDVKRQIYKWKFKKNEERKNIPLKINFLKEG